MPGNRPASLSCRARLAPAVALGSEAYVVLDVLSTLLTLTVAGGFLALARMSRQGLHLFVAAGFGLLGLGFLFVAASHFGGPEPEAGEAARVIGLLTGSLTLLLSYATFHAGGGRPSLAAVTLGVIGGTLIIGATLWFVPPVARLALSAPSLAAMHGTMTAAFLGCAAMAGYGWHQRPTWGRAMVPLGYLCWAFSSYTWIFIDLGDATRFLPLAYAWRFGALALVLWAMGRRPRAPSPRLAEAPP